MFYAIFKVLKATVNLVLVHNVETLVTFKDICFPTQTKSREILNIAGLGKCSTTGVFLCVWVYWRYDYHSKLQ